jgi:hypothetical protein
LHACTEQHAVCTCHAECLEHASFVHACIACGVSHVYSRRGVAPTCATLCRVAVPYVVVQTAVVSQPAHHAALRCSKVTAVVAVVCSCRCTCGMLNTQCVQSCPLVPFGDLLLRVVRCCVCVVCYPFVVGQGLHAIMQTVLSQH